MPAQPSVPAADTILATLTKARLAELARELGLSVPSAAPKDRHVEAILGGGDRPLASLLEPLSRDELKAICRAHELDDSGRARSDLIARILEAAGARPNLAVRDDLPAAIARSAAGPPRTGDIVQARHRQYLVEDVVPPPAHRHLTRVRLVCLDDDAQGRVLEVLWELELGARVLSAKIHGLGELARLDEPRHFAAYLHALKWSCVTATNARLFQSPFRAGILIKNHQLAPLKKALELPRVNLFIADDVGLGKTIEAGLVLQELLLRQRLEWMLVVCPASVTLQWRDEMEKRFGLRFELYNRAFVARRRQERGFQVNPWATHARFIISYQTLRRPEYRDPLLQHLGNRARKSLLILDEAHVAAPSTATKYAVDSRITKAIRDLAPRFENRLFLSATPHNGHSNSFSSLLEILDPQRFTRGVPVRNVKRLEPVMARRLKADLRELGTDEFPDRKVVQLDLVHESFAWHERGQARLGRLGDCAEPVELELARLLAEYTRLMSPGKGRPRLVFLNLQKRLLSSVEAFYRTLRLHADNVGRGGGAEAAQLGPALAQLDDSALAGSALRAPADLDGLDDDDVDDDTLDERDGAQAAASSRALPCAEGRARELLDRMLALAGAARSAPDAKVLALLAWIRRELCPGMALDGDAPSGKAARWANRRLLVFTEYGDTKRYLLDLLRAAAERTHEGEDRILTLHGGMGDEAREEVQRAFNAPPSEHPVRILVATDAAREGINLQGHCADLFHFDVPWNPARMEQRNGRIDRTLQPAAEVRCHYFFYPQRTEDVVLRKLVEKVDRIQRELGSLAAVVMDRLGDVLERGIDERTGAALDEAEQVPGRDVAQTELETSRELKKLAGEIEDAARIRTESERVMEFRRELLRDAIDVGCELAGASRLKAVEVEDDGQKVAAFELPELPESWQRTLDSLRRPRARDESYWDWRRTPPQPVVFEPPDRMTTSLCHLHLAHPFVQRILSRFTAQGFSAHDLSRVTVVRSAKDDHIARVIVFGRLSLFGPGAVRLHDQLISVASQWLESGGAGHLRPFADRADRRAIETLEDTLQASPDLTKIPEKARKKLLACAPGDFATLWTHVEKEAESRAHDARAALTARGQVESEALGKILADQRRAIEASLEERRQLALKFAESERDQLDQYEQDRRHMAARLKAIEGELQTEPAQIANGYAVALTRLTPVGMIYLWPGSR